MKSKIHKNFKFYVGVLTFAFCIFNFIGCEAFARKFTRKPKKENLPREEMVITPQEYKGPDMSKEELYRQYFLYWKSWHDELLESLAYGANHKKQIGCINEAIKNLEQLGSMLNAQKQEGIGIYLNRLRELRDLIIKDIYARNIADNRASADVIKRDILRNFSYAKVKDYLL